MLQQLNSVQHNTIHAAALWWHPNKQKNSVFYILKLHSWKMWAEQVS